MFESRQQHQVLDVARFSGAERSQRLRCAALRALRISVAHIVNLVANGMTPAEIVAEHPDLEEEDVRQALAYAAAIAEDQIYPIPAGK